MKTKAYGGNAVLKAICTDKQSPFNQPYSCAWRGGAGIQGSVPATIDRHDRQQAACEHTAIAVVASTWRIDAGKGTQGKVRAGGKKGIGRKHSGRCRGVTVGSTLADDVRLMLGLLNNLSQRNKEE